MRREVLIAIVLVVFFLGSLAGYEVRHVQEPTYTNLDSSLKEPPTMVVKINSQQDIFNDLKSIDCLLVPLTYNRFADAVYILNYTDFRRVAFNTGIVFYYNGTKSRTPEVSFIVLSVVFQGVTLDWVAEF